MKIFKKTCSACKGIGYGYRTLQAIKKDKYGWVKTEICKKCNGAGELAENG